MYAVLVEGGKTKTLALVINECGEVLGYYIGGPSGWTTIGFEKASKNLTQSIQRAIEKSSIEMSEVSYVVVGLSDIDTEKARGEYLKRLKNYEAIKAAKVSLIPDHIVAYYAVTLGEPGIAVIAGTGSIAYGKNSKGVEARVGGWGWFGGDEGGSVWIAMRAMNAVYKYLDGRGPRTTIAEKLLKLLGVSDPLEITDFVYSKAKEDVGELGEIAILVDEAANEGDEVAQQILSEAGRELALMAKVVYEKIYTSEDTYIAGGVGNVFSSITLRESFTRHAKEYMPGAYVKEPIVRHKPVVGLAAILAELLYLPKENLVNSLTRGLCKVAETLESCDLVNNVRCAGFRE